MHTQSISPRPSARLSTDCRQTPAAEAPAAAAILACDLDPIDCHLAGYGIADAAPCDVIYRRAVPRLLDLLDELGLHGVFFVVARDAAQQRRLLRRITDRGHEIASHSLTHPQPFRGLSDGELARETAVSRQALADAIGAPILGFRAPAWDVDGRVLRAVAAAGYRYDASVFPSPALALARLIASWRGSSQGPVNEMSSNYAWAPAQPHLVGEGAASLVEFPVAVTPRLRLPVYHTMSHLLPWRVFERILGTVLRRKASFSYELHAADLLDAQRDDMDRRIAVHPGMQIPLARKLDRLRQVFARIARQRRVQTYGQLLADGLEETLRLPATPSLSV
jgi:hypothetical protein